MENETHIRKKIGSINFSIFSPQLIKKMAAAKVVTPELYDKEGYPVDGSLMDLRLGVIDPGLRCKTCGSRLKECVGHTGYITLARPVIHINFVTVILAILRATCGECGKIYLPEDKLDANKEKLLKISKEKGGEIMRRKLLSLITTAKQTKCEGCNRKHGKISLEKPSTYMEGEKRITPIELRARLEKISDEQIPLLGLYEGLRPEWMVLTVLPIPPVTMRPSITLESGERSEDDLTHKLGDIVRINQRLFENINAGAPEIIVEDLWDLLQYHISTFFDNDISQLPTARHRSGQPLRTLNDRIKGKEGRIRHNLVGKRTNFSARSVISPDPMLRINEVGVPEVMARKLTVPETVTEWNHEYLKKFVEQGPKKYPGANYIVKPDGKKKKITEETQEQVLEELQPGYVVERHLLDGDVAIFNRQPSLHRMSMMCHKVRVLPYKTLRLNPAVCFPYNADFDGDEMNLHIPQTEEARAEAEILLSVQQQIISPRYGLSVIGGVQDIISGSYLLTQKDTLISRREAIDLLNQAGTNEKILADKEQFTGKEIFSTLLPSDFDFTGKCSSEEESDVKIRKGELKEGVMDKNNLGQGAGFMMRTLHKKYGEEFAMMFLDQLFKLSVAYQMKRGFTIGLADTDIDKETRKILSKIFDDSYKEVNELIKQYEDKQMAILPGKTAEETLEGHILRILNNARNEAGNIVASRIDKNSHTIIMTKSGARGNMLNLSQIAGCVGQQALRGKRIEKGFEGRTMSCFKKGDVSPSARGFIRSSFKGGLQPAEFFFQSMVSRDALIDTALRTPKSGYLYRRLANALQDLKVEYDDSVRDSGGRIIQFKYGEDGMDVAKSEGGSVNVQRIIKEVNL